MTLDKRHKLQYNMADKKIHQLGVNRQNMNRTIAEQKKLTAIVKLKKQIKTQITI